MGSRIGSGAHATRFLPSLRNVSLNLSLTAFALSFALVYASPAAAAAPANDNYANAVALAGAPETVSGATIDATSEPEEPCDDFTFRCGPSVWYTWQAPATATWWSFDTCATSYRSTLQVFTGNSLATLVPVFESDGGCGLGSRVVFPATPGTTYSIRVGPGFFSTSGTFELVSSTADADGDGVRDPLDDCPTGTRTGPDTDGDGCKNTGEDTDDDNDTVADGSDNCPLAVNGGQTDGDGDGQGDACDPDDALLDQKLMAPDGGRDAEFGISVAVDGDTTVVGAPGDANQRGAVYVYQRSGDSWTNTAKLTASDAAPGDRLGQSVAIDGDTIVAGASGDDGLGGTLVGSVYTFARTGAAARTETAKLTASDGADDWLGYSVAIDGDTIVASARSDDVGANGDQGSVYTFASTGAAARTETAKLTASDGAAQDGFGHRVAIDGDTIAAVAPGDQVGDNSSQGSVYTFARTGSATRTETAKLTASDGAIGDQLLSVAIDGDTIVAGARLDNIGADQDRGSVYTFASTGAAARTETAKLTASDGGAQDWLGISVAIGGDTIAAGSRDFGASFSGAVYTFARTGAAARMDSAKLTAPSNSSEFGNSVAVAGDTIVAGDSSDNVGGNFHQGSAMVFFSPADTDDDGVRDAVDDCPTGASSGLDTDGDGCKDTGEDSDDDNDTVNDGSDNCQTIANQAQTNTDNDAQGDACDSDDDNDTVADVSDGCHTLAASTASGCPIDPRSLTLSYSETKEKFKGKLTAQEPFCVSNDLVSVWKKVSGDDVLVGADEVNAQGKYVLSKRARPGKYYSTVEERVISDVAACGSATSPTLQLR